jgi:hypothetical protein
MTSRSGGTTASRSAASTEATARFQDMFPDPENEHLLS